MNASTPSEFPVWEQALMRHLGLGDRDDMRSMRDELLQEGVDWEKINGRIMLSEKAAEKLATHLRLFPHCVAAILTAQAAARVDETATAEKARLAGSPEAAATVKNAPPKNGAPAFGQRLILVPVRVVNPHILICRLPDSNPADRTGWVNVRVKSVVNFRPLPAETGEILARHIAGALWEFAGNPKSQSNVVPRCPRWPGRW